MTIAAITPLRDAVTWLHSADTHRGPFRQALHWLRRMQVSGNALNSFASLSANERRLDVCVTLQLGCFGAANKIV